MPFKQWRQQNQQRKYAVPEQVMEKMAGKLELPTPDEAHQVSYYIDGNLNHYLQKNKINHLPLDKRQAKILVLRNVDIAFKEFSCSSNN